MTEESGTVLMPSEVSSRVGFFDRFAGHAAQLASRAWFFAFCVLLILLWAPSITVIGSVDTWQLIINTATTIVTFLMVALLQNSQTRADQGRPAQAQCHRRRAGRRHGPSGRRRGSGRPQGPRGAPRRRGPG